MERESRKSILAKRREKGKEDISLQEHTKDLWMHFEELKRKIKFKGFNEIEKLLRIAVFFHDLGKVIPSFQIRMGNVLYQPRILIPYIPHSLFSLLWIDGKELEKCIPDDKKRKILLSSIAFHHWRDNFSEILICNEKDFKRAVREIKKVREDIKDNLKREFSNSEFKDLISCIGFNEDFYDMVLEGDNLFDFVVPPYYEYFLPQRIEAVSCEDLKRCFVLLLGLLIRLDHFASLVERELTEEERKNVKIEKELVKEENIIENIEGEIGKKNIWQEALAREYKDKNVVLVAPTGVGKTEFAFLWGADSKLIFTLPLRSAVNFMFERAKGIFGKDILGQDNVGLLHSDADIYLLDKREETESHLDEEEYEFKTLELAKELSLPVVISTGDQFFPSALKYPGYEKIYATLAYSKLVIDEVQAYDPRACAMVVKLLEDVVKLGGKFLLMTATLPVFAKKEIEKRVGVDNFRLDEEKYKEAKARKHKVKIRNQDIEEEEVINEIIEKANQGRRVLVVVNTVSRARAIYKKIEDRNFDNVFILHSRFAFNDRGKKEDDLKKRFSNPKPVDEHTPKILVATQVVEASLDIDTDCLYTELAPLDALVQRMGRVLRRVRVDDDFEYEEDQSPNIIIFYQLEKRGGNEKRLKFKQANIYENEILGWSLRILLEKSGEESFPKDKNKIRDEYESDKTKDLIKDLIPRKYQKIEDKSVKKKSKEKMVSKEFILSEQEKKRIVEELYEFLPENCQYLTLFYQTLDILDAGYMSEKKEEARRVFREIYSVPVVCANRIKDFKKEVEVEEFINYTNFRKKIIAKFVVNVIPQRWKRQRWGEVIKEIDEEKIERRYFYRLKRWLRGIYIGENLNYLNKEGVIEKEDKKQNKE